MKLTKIISAIKSIMPVLALSLGLCGCATHRAVDASGSVVTQFSTYDALGHGLSDGTLAVLAYTILP